MKFMTKITKGLRFLMLLQILGRKTNMFTSSALTKEHLCVTTIQRASTNCLHLVADYLYGSRHNSIDQ